MQVLVTGANGHVGNNLCRALVERGHRVRGSVRSLDDPAKSAPLSDLAGVDNFEIVELDVRDAARFDAAVGDVSIGQHRQAQIAEGNACFARFTQRTLDFRGKRGEAISDSGR